MPCHAIKVPGGIAIACTREWRKPCQSPGCTREHVALCDFPLSGAAAGKTCDRRMCQAHRTPVGPDRDFCPVHARTEEKTMAKKQPAMQVISETGITERQDSFLPEKAALPALAKPDVADLDQGASSLEREAASIVVADAATQARATEMVAGVKDATRELEERRDSLVRPLNAHVKFINALFRPIALKLEVVSGVLRQKLLVYHQEQERRAAEERRRAEEAIRKADEERRRAAVEKAKADAARAKAALDAEFAATPVEQRVAEAVVVQAGKIAAAAEATLAQSTQQIAAASTALVAAAPPPRMISGGGRQAQFKKRWDFEVKDQQLVPREFLQVDATAIRAAIHTGRREIAGVRIFQTDQLAVG